MAKQFLPVIFIFSLIFCAPVLAEESHTLVLLDLSHSMTKPIKKGQPRKIELTRIALKDVLRSNDSNLGIRTFGFGVDDKKTNCQASELVVPISGKPQDENVQRLLGQEPVGHDTPIHFALQAAAKDLHELVGRKKIILLSDGQETCKQDPETLAEKLAAQNITINTIGIGHPGQFSQLGAIALAGGGEFRLGDNLESLKAALKLFSGAKKKPIKLSAAVQVSQLSSNLVRVKPVSIKFPELEKAKEKEKPQGPVVALEIILDASGSMMGKIDGQIKMHLAKRVLKDTARRLDSEFISLGLRAYGFDNSLEKTPESSCPNTELVVPFAVRNAQVAATTATNLSAYGYTPLAESLRLAGADLKSFDKLRQTIVLISDGKETCGGDPVKEIEKLREAGINVRVHVVGFDIDAQARTQLKAIAKAGSGTYYDAANAIELANSLKLVIDSVQREAIEPPDERFIKPIKGGESFETATRVSPGAYTLEQHVAQGERVYFFVETKKAQLGVLRGFNQGRRLVMIDGELKESPADIESAFRVDIYPPNIATKKRKKPVRGMSPSIKEGSKAVTHYFDVSGEGFYFSVGSPHSRINKDALFELLVEEAGDVFQRQDGPEKKKEQPVVLPRGKFTAHLGIEDKADLYQIDGEEGEELSLKVSFPDKVWTRAAFHGRENWRYKVEAYHPKTLQRVKRWLKLSGATELSIKIPDDAESVILRVVDNNPILYHMFTSYEVSVE